MFCAWSLGLSGSALSSSEYNLCKGGLYSDVSEFPDFTLTTALRTWPSRPWSKCSIFPTICSCTQTMSPTCTSRGEFALLKYRSCSRSSVRYSDLHRFQKWFRTRYRNLALVSAVPLLRSISLLYKILPTNLEVCEQPFILFIRDIWGETVLWGAVFTIQTSDRMHYFTVFQDKLHSFNIQDDQSLAFSETVQKISKITYTASRFSLLISGRVC